jgi:hypothetical protein
MQYMIDDDYAVVCDNYEEEESPGLASWIAAAMAALTTFLYV